MGLHRLLACTSKGNVDKTFGKHLGGWTERMHEVCALTLDEVVARDPK